MHLLSAHREQADFYRLGAVVFQVEDEFQGFVLRWVLCEVDVVSICFGSNPETALQTSRHLTAVEGINREGQEPVPGS